MLKKEFSFRCLFLSMCAVGAASLTEDVMASAYQIWEQDAASVGNYHAGRTAEAKDASVAFYNPGGIPLIRHQQLVVGSVGYFTRGDFQGTIATNTFQGGALQQVSATTKGFNLAPDIHYVAPLTDRLGFGFSVDAPFGLETDYGQDTPLKYAAVLSQLRVIDVSPSLGLSINEHLSVGMGVDVQQANVKLTQVGVLGPLEATGTNDESSTAYGYHLGGMYQFTPATRAGLSYHSRVIHHLSGTDRAEGPLANFFNAGQPIISTNAKLNLTLPAYASLGIYHDVNSRWSVMGTAIYTLWNSTQENIIFQNLSGLTSTFQPTTAGGAIVPQHYHNTWLASVGADYHLTESIMLRAGLGYDESPVESAFRSVQIPDTNRYIAAIGARMKVNRALAVDVGWSHVYTRSATIGNPPQNTGGQITTVRGTMSPNAAEVFGLQLTWNIT